MELVQCFPLLTKQNTVLRRVGYSCYIVTVQDIKQSCIRKCTIHGHACKKRDYVEQKWCTEIGDSAVVTATGGGLDRSQWPSGLRRGSAADKLLGLRVRIPPGAWMSVLCVLYSKDERQKPGQSGQIGMDKVQRKRYKSGLRRGSAAAHLLGLRVRISAGAYICCVLYSKGKRHKSGQSRQRNNYRKSTKREKEKEFRKKVTVG